MLFFKKYLFGIHYQPIFQISFGRFICIFYILINNFLIFTLLDLHNYSYWNIYEIHLESPKRNAEKWTNYLGQQSQRQFSGIHVEKENFNYSNLDSKNKTKTNHNQHIVESQTHHLSDQTHQQCALLKRTAHKTVNECLTKSRQLQYNSSINPNYSGLEILVATLIRTISKAKIFDEIQTFNNLVLQIVNLASIQIRNQIQTFLNDNIVITCLTVVIVTTKANSITSKKRVA